MIQANNFFSFILKTCKGFQNNWRLTVSNPPGRLTVVIARGDKLKLLVYTSVSCFFRIFCMTAVATFLGNFCARNWRAASHRYWSPGKCPPFDCCVSSFTPIHTRSPPIQPQFTLTHLYPSKFTLNYHNWFYFWQNVFYLMNSYFYWEEF